MGYDEYETDSDESGIKTFYMFKGQEREWGSCPRCDGALFVDDACKMTRPCIEFGEVGASVKLGKRYKRIKRHLKYERCIQYENALKVFLCPYFLVCSVVHGMHSAAHGALYRLLVFRVPRGVRLK